MGGREGAVRDEPLLTGDEVSKMVGTEIEVGGSSLEGVGVDGPRPVFGDDLPQVSPCLVERYLGELGTGLDQFFLLEHVLPPTEAYGRLDRRRECGVNRSVDL